MEKIAVVIPCYKASEQVLSVLADVPKMVNAIYCIDDVCPDNTGKLIQESNKDKRVQVLFNDSNQGVGGAVMHGYKQALADGMEIIVKIDADGQMNPKLIPTFIQPILDGDADYTKGNRFYSVESLTGMPKLRIFGNTALSFFSKLSTGYWNLFDSTNGFTAIHGKVLKLLPLDKISKRYFFESDMLFRLNTLRAVVKDIPMNAVYAQEKSNLSAFSSVFEFSYKHIRNFFKRIFYNYYLRDFSIASVEWLLGPLLLIYGVAFGIDKWAYSVVTGLHATAGQVMNAALPTIIGLQLFLSALNFDIANSPRNVLHPLLPDDSSET